jgi:hypothetical protein
MFGMNGDQIDALEEALDALDRENPDAARDALHKLDRDHLFGLQARLHELQSLLLEEILINPVAR